MPECWSNWILYVTSDPGFASVTPNANYVDPNLSSTGTTVKPIWTCPEDFVEIGPAVS